MEYRSINIADKFAQFSEHWSPKIIARMNDYHFKLVKFHGEFVSNTRPRQEPSAVPCLSKVRVP
jgi:hypothetical protein